MTARHLKEKNQGIMSVVVVVAVLVAVVGGGVYLYQSGAITIPGITPTATVEPRVNPEPTSGYSVSVAEVKPGNTVVIESVTVSDLSSVAVIKDGTTQVMLGKTELLKAGTHTDLTIKLSGTINNGDVIYIRLMDKTGKPVQSEQNLNIEVMKNVGMLMSHYENEY